jgi:hypothetical protein
MIVAALVAVYFIFGDNIKSLWAGNPLAAEAKKIQEDVKNILDVNKDGKVDVADAKEAVKKTATKAKKMTSKKKK